MNSEWQNFLCELGVANITSDSLLAPGTMVSALPDEVVLHVSGEDAESFLQGQFSNDVAALDDPGSQLTTWSTPKGRVLALFRLIRVGDHFLIRLPAALAETFTRRLRMYVLRAKVVIEEQNHLVSFGLAAEQLPATVDALLGQLPSETDGCVVQGECCVVKVRGTVNRYEVTVPVTSAIELWNQCASQAQQGGEGHWRLQNIDAGVPTVGSATSEAFVLQMMNLQHIDGVSFKKGCFPGQEVVARMQYLGKLKRRMYLLSGSADAGVPAPGDDLYTEGKSSAIGKVVDAQPAGDGTYRMLAVCAIEAMQQPVYQEPEAKHRVTEIELPYSVNAA
ncbi:MAG: folate-binding protein [Pseudomonadota bacterium]